MSKPMSRALSERLKEPTIVSSALEFIDAQRDARTVSFLDDSTIEHLDQLAIELASNHGEQVPVLDWRKLVAAVSLGPVLAICSKPIQTALGWLQPHPWLSHVMSASMLEQPNIVEHLGHVMTALTQGEANLTDWLGTAPGRRSRLTHASKRGERLERMTEFFESRGVDQDTVRYLREAADELLTNAFYEAPVAAGAQRRPIERSMDVSLPRELACDIVYGSKDDLAIVRVRDPFGSLSRERLGEVLTRYSQASTAAQNDVRVGGSGMGLGRLFSAASVVAISVVNNRSTEVLVGFARHKVEPRPYALHYFFKGGAKRQFWRFSDEDTGSPSNTISVTIKPE